MYLAHNRADKKFLPSRWIGFVRCFLIYARLCRISGVQNIWFFPFDCRIYVCANVFAPHCLMWIVFCVCPHMSAVRGHKQWVGPCHHYNDTYVCTAHAHHYELPDYSTPSCVHTLPLPYAAHAQINTRHVCNGPRRMRTRSSINVVNVLVLGKSGVVLTMSIL